MVLPFDDSRRLTGANLFFAQTGAVLEAADPDLGAATCEGWRERVDRARRHLDWDVTALPIVTRRHRTGTSLALAAPFDQLLTATEINEWALCAALHAQAPERWHDLEAALRAAAVEQDIELLNRVPPVLDERAALARFARLAAAERPANLARLVNAAIARGLPHVLDEQALTLGTGVGGCTWSLDTLPALDAVPWSALRGVPTAVVTGSNGKTTTVRVLAACLRAQGWTDGYCCTDGILVAGETLDRGDYSGPAGTRRVLRDRRVEGAALEVARGGILRRGLALGAADVAVVTNVSADHFGEYGIDDLDGLADTKLTVGRLVQGRGVLVLNADDDLLRRKAAHLGQRWGTPPALGWFAADHERAELVAHRRGGGATCGVRDGRLLLNWSGTTHDLGVVASMPLTAGGHARYNVMNLAAAALAAAALGIAPATIAAVFGRFGTDVDDNAGRLMRFDVRGVHFVVDYAHNPDGLRGLLEVAQHWEEPRGRLLLLLGHAGNRLDADIAALAQTAATFRPDLVVLKENEAHLRGRQPGEIPAVLRRALLASGVAPAAIALQGGEVSAAQFAIDQARPGDVVVLPMHARAARDEIVRRLQALAAPG